jgi:hypothetical protein
LKNVFVSRSGTGSDCSTEECEENSVQYGGFAAFILAGDQCDAFAEFERMLQVEKFEVGCF